MEIDEAGTLAALKAHRSELVDPTIAQHGGRIVKLMGDGALVEFASVVDAVECAVAVQEGMARRNLDVAADTRIDFRIGVNLGDVIVEGDDIYGDGVNVAARLEALAEPGGICISGMVHENIVGKLDHGFADGGEQSVKNIARPIRVWRWTADATPRAGTSTSAEAVPLPDKPSIAILPFANMSGDPEQEYFSDGITEDLITELSRFTDVFVIARNSTFAFKGKHVDVTEVGRKLGARYIVEGSVRKAGERVRVTAQLVDSSGGNHLWAERYDRRLEDIFAVQDEVVRQIAASVPGRLNRHAVNEIRRKPPRNLTAYDHELRGRWAYLHLAEGLQVALQWYEKAVEADPDYALAHAGLGMASAFGAIALGGDADSMMAAGKEHARRAVALDDKNPTVNIYAAFTYHVTGEHKLVRRHAQRAVELNPNDPLAAYVQACALSYTGDPEKALEWFSMSESLEPYAPDDQRLDTLCDCCYMLDDYERIFEIHAGYQNVPAFLYLVLAAAYARAGRPQDAQAAVQHYKQKRPPGHDPAEQLRLQIQMCSRPEDRERWRDGYRKAGLIP